MKLKIILLALSMFTLSGCAVLDYSDKCYFAEVPKPYLIDSKGRFINRNGEVVTHKVENPYYTDYLTCYPKARQQTESVKPSNSVNSTLKTNYIVNAKQYTLIGQNRISANGNYVKSVFVAEDQQSQIQHETFPYAGPRPFIDRFLNDINSKEGRFHVAQSNGIHYIIGKNNYNAYVIYIVKDINDSNISIVQLVSQQPFSTSELAQLVNDLNTI